MLRQLRQTGSRLLLIGSIALLSGCEYESDLPSGPEIPKDGEIPAGTANVRGTWYSDGRQVGKSHWNWSNLYLHQDGTNLAGTIRSEYYDSRPVTGNVNGDRLTLIEQYEPVEIKGIIHGEKLTTSPFLGYGYNYLNRPQDWRRINAEAPAF
jgi:hypothetical protein